MPESSAPPPPPTSSGAKYALLGIILLAIAGGLLCWRSQSGGPPAGPGPSVVDAGAPPPPSPVVEGLEIPPPAVDAGTAEDAGLPVQAPPVRTGGGTWACKGEISRDALQKTVRAYKGAVRDCYERRLKVNNELRGTVQVTVRIDASGRVDGVKLGGTMNDRIALMCIGRVAQKWTFPKPTGDAWAVVEVPFKLTPRR